MQFIFEAQLTSPADFADIHISFNLHFSLTVAFVTYFYPYLTIRLRARDFYEVIIDEGEARINYHLIEIE